MAAPWLPPRAFLEWAREQRARLVRAVLVLVQAWLDAGRPLAEARLGSFERWSGVIGGILAHTGIPGFLGSLEDLYEAADDEGRMWRAFTAAWWAVYGPEPQQVKTLNELCDTHELMVSVRGDKSPRSEQTRLGKALARVRDRLFGGLRVGRSGWEPNVRFDPKADVGRDAAGPGRDERRETEPPRGYSRWLPRPVPLPLGRLAGSRTSALTRKRTSSVTRQAGDEASGEIPRPPRGYSRWLVRPGPVDDLGIRLKPPGISRA